MTLLRLSKPNGSYGLSPFSNDIWSDLEGLFNDVNSESKMLHKAMSTDIVETKDGYEFHFDLPGFSSEDISAEVEGGVLSVTAKKETSTEDKNEKYLLKERSSSSFHRSFKLPESIDSESMDAQFKSGVLMISMKKSEKAKPKKLDVKQIG